MFASIVLEDARYLLVHRQPARTRLGEEEEDEKIQRRLLKVVRVVLDVAERESLDTGGREMKVDRAAPVVLI